MKVFFVKHILFDNGPYQFELALLIDRVVAVFDVRAGKREVVATGASGLGHGSKSGPSPSEAFNERAKGREGFCHPSHARDKQGLLFLVRWSCGLVGLLVGVRGSA